MVRSSSHPDALEARLALLRESVSRRVMALEAKAKRRILPLERAKEEFLRNLEYLRHQEAQAEPNLIRPAILREELRIQHLEKEIRRLEEAWQQRARLLWNRARQRAARLLAKSKVQANLDQFFPPLEETEGKDEPHSKP